MDTLDTPDSPAADVTPAEDTGDEAAPAPTTADVPEDAAQIPTPDQAEAPQDDPVIYAVLLGPRGGLVAGQVVFAPTSEVTAAIATGALRLPDAGEVARAEPFHYALPPADS